MSWQETATESAGLDGTRGESRTRQEYRYTSGKEPAVVADANDPLRRTDYYDAAGKLKETYKDPATGRIYAGLLAEVTSVGQSRSVDAMGVVTETEPEQRFGVLRGSARLLESSSRSVSVTLEGSQTVT